MIYKIGNVDDVDMISQFTEDAKKAVTKFAKILTEIYGADRDVDHDYGGYVLYVTKGTDVEDIKKYFDYDAFPLEFAELFGDDICAAIYITSTEYAVVIVMSIEDIPEDIYNSLPQTEYRVQINETLVKAFSVEAISKKDAVRKVKEAYNASEIILTADDFSDVEFNCQENGGKENDY